MKSHLVLNDGYGEVMKMLLNMFFLMRANRGSCQGRQKNGHIKRYCAEDTHERKEKGGSGDIRMQGSGF